MLLSVWPLLRCRAFHQVSVWCRRFRLRECDPVNREVELLNNVKNDLCRLLKPGAEKVRVFLSHAKQDGLGITKEVRRYLHEQTKLGDFFDATDIPDGARFAEFITENAGSLPVLLAIQTDTYGSRDWCRIEVLEAKRRRVPISVLAAIQHGEARSFPYLGNVPVVCWHGKASLPVVVGVLLDEVLRDRYFPERVRAICLQRGISMKHQVFTYPPELFTVLSHRVETHAAGGKLGCYLYPGTLRSARRNCGCYANSTQPLTRSRRRSYGQHE